MGPIRKTGRQRDEINEAWNLSSLRIKRQVVIRTRPPEAAFNDQRILEADIHKLIGSEDLIKDLTSPKGRYNQRGAGKFTLCEQCNTKTGDWYAKSYVKFGENIVPTMRLGCTRYDRHR